MIIISNAMIKKELKEISIEDVKELIDNSVPEGKTIDYKEKLSFQNDKERKEFLYDVTSFANASGGDLIFGIKENSETGYPQEIVGIQIENTDKLQLQIDSIIRDNISPRLTGVSYQFIPNKDKYIFIIRAIKSWNKPHQVTFKGTDKFYSRSNNGKYKLDVFELKNAFLSSGTLQQNISNFRNERISNIIANEGSAPLLDNGKIILHITPVTSFDTGKLIDLVALKCNNDLLRPIGEQGYSTRYNFDGLLSYSTKGSSGKNHSYFQVFKNGIIETVDSWVVQPFKEGRKELYIESIEEFVIKFIKRVPRIYEQVNIEPPYIILLTITGVNDYKAGFHNKLFFFTESRIEKDVLVFPDILIQSWTNIDIQLKPLFDSLWNAVGLEESASFKNGQWNKNW